VIEPTRTEPQRSAGRHYAGVLIAAAPARFAAVCRALDAIPGVLVHHLDPATGRCVAVLESGDRAEGERLFGALGQVPDLRSVDLVYHFVDRADGEVVFPEPEP